MHVHVVAVVVVTRRTELSGFAYSSLEVLSRFACGSLKVLSRFAYSLLEVLSRFGGGTVEVRWRYCRGSVEVLLRFGGGTVEVRLRFAGGTVEVRYWYGAVRKLFLAPTVTTSPQEIKGLWLMELFLGPHLCSLEFLRALCWVLFFSSFILMVSLQFQLRLIHRTPSLLMTSYLYKPISTPCDLNSFKEDVAAVEQWSHDNHLTLNSTKCKWMLISRRKSAAFDNILSTLMAIL